MYSVHILTNGFVSISVAVTDRRRVRVHRKQSGKAQEELVNEQFFTGWWVGYKAGKVMVGQVGQHDLTKPLLEWTDTESPVEGVKRLEMTNYRQEKFF